MTRLIALEVQMNDLPQPVGTPSALCDPSCLAICISLTDGRAKTAGELARAARISPSTAKECLASLLEAGIVAAEKQWQHVYFTIATPRIAEMIEAFDEAAMLRPQLRQVSSSVPVKLRAGRTCYDHLAGPVAVGICEALASVAIIVRDGAEFRLGPGGAKWMQAAGLAVADRHGTRRFAKCCLDWSERRPHLGGVLGAAILQRLIDARLAVRGEGREMSVSSLGNVLENLRCAPPT